MPALASLNNKKTDMHRKPLVGLLLLCVSLLAGCASQPSNINNACVIYGENGGWFNNWYDITADVQQEYGVPKSIILATIRQESAFKENAKPPRTYLLGFIPWFRPSDAFGYPQALDSTWSHYQKQTGRYGAERDVFSDAAYFVGWYYARSHQINGIALTNAYDLYLTYYFGHTGYARGDWRDRPDVRRIAQKVARQAKTYRRQMRQCGYAP